jgi:DNA-binding transcriptional LysR family regulator
MQNPLFSPKILDIQALECFFALAETRNFHKASLLVNKSQSAVSQQISKLEKILGCSLINRDNKNSLTSNGEYLYTYAYKILKLHQEALTHFSNPELSGEINFGLPEDFATVFLSEILRDFKIKYPSVLVNVECDLTVNLLKKFQKNNFDLVLVKTTDEFEIKGNYDFFNEKLVWVSKQDTTIEIKNGVIPLVLSPKPCIYRSRALDSLESKNLKYKITYSSPSFAGATAAVKADIGITVLPEKMIPSGLTIYHNKKLPDLKDTHISILINCNAPESAKSFAQYIVQAMAPGQKTKQR